jgi:succinate dehydrogenase/fumarate reductase iron-sulfur protein
MIKLKLQIARSPATDVPVSFDIEVADPNSRVLDVLVFAREQRDASLCFRYACRVGVCGSCAMVINGKEGLACQTTIGGLGATTLKLEPLRGLPVQCDLMVDMAPFFASVKRLEAAFKPTEPRSHTLKQIPPGAETRSRIEAQNGCVTCGACYSACAGIGTPVGCQSPAALNRILMLALDERDALGRRRLGKLDASDPVLRSSAMPAGFACPQEIPLGAAMTQLRSLAEQGGGE